MALLSENEINLIAKQLELSKIIKWNLEDFEDKTIGYLGDHLKLIIIAEKNGVQYKVQLFVKCMPRFEKWKSEFLQELKFFDNEFIMLKNLFDLFQNGKDMEKWRPKLHYIREDLFVFEDVSILGYKTPFFKEPMTFNAMKATIKTLARFHAQSYIYEEKRSKELGRPYRIWDEFSENLQELSALQVWRDTGRNAAIDFLKEFSKYKSNPDFIEKIEDVMPKLYEKAKDQIKPGSKYRNVVIHRDLWSNNIFIKEGEVSEPHALIVDFQTVIYTSPMLDLSSVMYFNTLRPCREKHAKQIIDIYHNTLTEILEESNINIDTIFPKNVLMDAYNESLIYGMTQASLMVPIIAMSREKKEEIFCDPVRSEKASLISRSEEFIEIANEDSVYKNRVSELLDEIVERYIYPRKHNDVNTG